MGVVPGVASRGTTKALAGVSAEQGLVLRAPEGTRTPNLLIRSQMLYPLSYGRMATRAKEDFSAPRPSVQTVTG